ncbi:MAG: hypothetical protein ACREEY_06485, partial [Brevundimonas sp.]
MTDEMAAVVYDYGGDFEDLRIRRQKARYRATQAHQPAPIWSTMERQRDLQSGERETHSAAESDTSPTGVRRMVGQALRA